MRVKFIITFLGDLPPNTNVGDELTFDGSFTVNSISSQLIDVSSPGCTQYAAGDVEVEAFCNDTKIGRP